MPWSTNGWLLSPMPTGSISSLGVIAMCSFGIIEGTESQSKSFYIQI